MLTSMVTAMAMTTKAGQKSTPYTVDQQLYKVAVDIIFSDMQRFKDFTPILGGMHFLESFISAIGELAGPLGLCSILGGAFSSVEAMLKGKKFPQNVRALRMLLEELLRPILQPEEEKQRGSNFNETASYHAKSVEYKKPNYKSMGGLDDLPSPAYSDVC